MEIVTAQTETATVRPASVARIDAPGRAEVADGTFETSAPYAADAALAEEAQSRGIG